MTRWQMFKNAVLPKFLQEDTLEPADSSSRGWNTIFDFRSGAFQQDDAFVGPKEIKDGMAVAVVYACIRLLVWDISKLPVQVKRLLPSGIWQVGKHQTLSPIIKAPNYFQIFLDFIQSWLFSYFIAGNAYILKTYGRLGLVSSLFVLDPAKVQVLVSHETGAIFYRIGMDPLTPISAEDTIVAASSIIHHRYMAFGHPLIGTSLLGRAQAAARMRSGIIESGADLAENNAVPPGLLIAPEGLSDDQLDAIAAKWKTRKSGEIGVVDAAFTFQSLQAKFIDTQAKEFAEVAAIDICTACNVPAWKVGVGPRPVGLDIEAANIVYYQDSLQLPLTHMEQLIDAGLDVPDDTSIEFCTDELFRMDSKGQAEVDGVLVKAGILAPNEGRARRNLPPVKGGDTPYMQQQNFSLAALFDRDQAAPAPSASGPSPAVGGGQGPAADDPEPDDTATAESSKFRALLPWAGVWSAGEEYPPNCFVTHKGSLWVRLDIVQAGEPGTEGGWALVAKGGKGSKLPGNPDKGTEDL